MVFVFFFLAEESIHDAQECRVRGEVYIRQGREREREREREIERERERERARARERVRERESEREREREREHKKKSPSAQHIQITQVTTAASKNKCITHRHKREDTYSPHTDKHNTRQHTIH